MSIFYVPAMWIAGFFYEKKRIQKKIFNTKIFFINNISMLFYYMCVKIHSFL